VFGRRKDRAPLPEPSARTYRVVTIWAGVAAGLALVAVSTFAVQAKSFSVLATGAVVAAAAGFTGALVGFIFGVPRVLASDQPRVRGSAPGSIAPIGANTNLEQISDWLTKILVGIGLTQFGPIGRAAGQLFAALAPAFTGANVGKDVGAVFAGGLVLYMVTCGFATGWLFTRLFLGKAMATADRAAAAAELMDKAEQAEQAGDEETARAYRSQARETLEPSEAASGVPAEAGLSPAHRALMYEDEVLDALRRLGFSVERDPRDGPIDLRVAAPDDPARQADVVVRYRPQGSFTTGDLRRMRGQFAFQPLSRGLLVVTNTPLTKEVERQNSEITGDPRRVVAVTWTGEDDDQSLVKVIRSAIG